MTIVITNINGGLERETRERITLALPTRLETIAGFLTVPLIEVDHYFSKRLHNYDPATRGVKQERYVSSPLYQAHIAQQLPHHVPTIAESLGESVASVKMFFEPCFVKAIGKPVPTTTAAPARKAQKDQAKAAAAHA